MKDLGYMTGLTSEDCQAVLVTNGTDITDKTRKYLEDKDMKIVLGWTQGMKIMGIMDD